MSKAEDDDLKFSAKLRFTNDGTMEYLFEERDNLMLNAGGNKFNCRSGKVLLYSSVIR